MPPRLAATAAFVALLWAGNFVLTQAALDAHITSLLLVALRFALASSLVLVTPRPTGIGWRPLAVVGLGLGLGQFGLATLAMQAGLTPGLTSLVLQMQCLATLGLAAAFLGERLSLRMIGGSAFALLGMAGLVSLGAPSRLGLVLASGAALAAAALNIAIKRVAPSAEPVRLAVWISPFPVLPLLALSWLMEASPIDAFRDADFAVLGPAIVYGGLISTVAGTALWTRLLRQAPASRVAPFMLLVPVFGAALSALVDGRLPNPGAVLPFCVVLAGLAVAQSGSHSPALEIAQPRPGRGLSA
jgi:O-acetylserine/cysteine efflux transporter